ncbi:U3 small nucleolar RNA-associated protein 25 homolog [Zophobas morio]|uniref:U3 small nucleolar RNA-associated protein 25 homolog n=1 Tax=Zophobas morio TaxID=2755281 RepID=UPI003082BD75
MARGKVKYKDVVGGHSKTNKKFSKKKVNSRKTYSLYQANNGKKSKKRKFNTNIEELNEKRQKTEETVQVEEESSESEEDTDHMQQLRASFSSNLSNKKLVAVESSDDSFSEEEHESREEKGDNLDESGSVKSDSELLENSQDESDDVESEGESDSDVNIENEEQDNNKDDSSDPFVKHVCYELHESVLNSLQNVPMLVKEHIEHWPTLGRVIIQIPQYKETEKTECNVVTIEEEKKFAPPGSVPSKINNTDLSKPENIFIKNQIINNLTKANKSLSYGDVLFTDLQNELFSVMNNYQDIYYSQRSFSNAEEIRFVYCLHLVNHILKTRLKVVHHNARLSNKDDVPEDFRDQGLVRPKILVIVPFKDSAYQIIQTLINILLPEDKSHVMKRKRFVEEYTGNEISMPKKNPKPEDYELTFSGNVSDDFKIGITVTKKSLKLYADFYSSDIIIASPLGLRTLIGAEGESERDYDFLASIELLVLDQAELFFMQNWDHLIHALNHLHLQPKNSHGTDFSRVRTWSLNGWAKYYRQTMIFSSIALPEINAVFNKKCNNYAGKAKVSNPVEFGAIRQVFVQIPHVFHKFEASNVQQLLEARFDFFINKILPQQKDSLMKQTLIYVSSYFDFVRLRNYFKKEELSFVQICEYSKESKIARARDMFYHGDVHFLLYTERHHFYNRIRVKGIRHLIFYEPPAFPHFYYEICNFMQEANMNKKVGSMTNMTVNVLYSKYDVQRISAIVGTERAMKILNSDRSVHMMVTGAE